MSILGVPFSGLRGDFSFFQKIDHLCYFQLFLTNRSGGLHQTFEEGKALSSAPDFLWKDVNIPLFGRIELLSFLYILGVDHCSMQAVEGALGDKALIH